MRKTVTALIIMLLISTAVHAGEVIGYEKPKMEYEDKTIANIFALSSMSEGTFSNFAEEKCEKAKELGLLDERIVPDYRKTITKAQFCSLGVNLYEKLSGEELNVTASNPFVDTKNPDVLKLVSVGVVQGETYNTFCPDKRITTEQAEIIIQNIIRKTADMSFEVSDSKKFMSFEKAVIKIYDSYSTVINQKKSTEQKIEELKDIYKEGTYWNKNGVPCIHESDGFEYCNYYEGKAGAGIQCHGFGVMLSDEIFGREAPVRTYNDLNELRVGDMIRYNDRHTMIVTKIEEDHIVVAEANFNHDCKITWNREVHKEFLQKCDLLCVSRY